ncbi:MAG: 6-phosphogluconolactonase [Nocardioidaceae bacterium]
MSTPTVLVQHTSQLLAESVAARLITELVDVQSTGRVASWVLTGGTIADKIHRAVASSPAREAVDWRLVDYWWGDERFVDPGDPDRNETQARAALLDQLRLDEGRVHPVPGPAESGADPDAAAQSYAETLRAAARPEDHGPVPMFDILMLGVGPDGHVASLFPERPALYDERPVTAVRGAPKPPPTRITLTLPSLRHARQVWFVVSGAAKARAVHLALGGAGVVQVPAAGPKGLQRTLWLLDRDAAAQLPPGLARL